MILVTGGTGLLGSHLLFQLTLGGSEVRALYRDDQRVERVRKVFRYYLSDRYEELFSQIQWIKGDILDLPSL